MIESSDRAAITRIMKIFSYLTDKEQTIKEILEKIRYSEDDTRLFDISKKTENRDFDVLCQLTEYVQVNKEKRPYTYKLSNYFHVKGIDNAVAFVLIESFIKELLPLTVTEHLEPYFFKSKKILAEKSTKSGRENLLSKWPDKVAIINRGIELVSPEYDDAILKEMLLALYNEKKVLISYQTAEQNINNYMVSVLSLVLKNEITYFVLSCDEWDNGQQARHFPLHRIKSAEQTSKVFREPSGYVLSDYIHNNKGFSYPLSAKRMIKFEGYFSNLMKGEMEELKLSQDQRIVKLDEHRFRLTANVQNNHQFYWWLLGLGQLVEVVKPKSLRNKIIGEIKNMDKIYTHSN